MSVECSVRRPVGRRVVLRACALALLWTLPAWSAGEGEAGVSVAPGADVGSATAAAGAAANLELANRHIMIMRVGVMGATPGERAEAAAERLKDIIQKGGPLAVTTRPVPEGEVILVDGRVGFRVLQGDVDAEAGESVTDVTAAAAASLRTALAEVREAEDARSLAAAIGWALLATILLVGAAWIVLRAYHRLADWVRGIAHRRFTRNLPSWTSEVLGEAALGRVFTLPLKLLAALLMVLLGYEWAGFMLTRFPYTRPLGESLRENVLEALGNFGKAMLEAIPGLLFVALIFLLARIAVRTVRAFFAGVERGHIQVAALDESTARPTGKLVTAAIWLFAMVAAYPYIPGSDSEAFKGIGVFVGLMVSIGASGIVSQAVSGLMLMYTRAMRPGEYVQIGDTEGTVKTVGFVATRIETVRHEEVNVPNSVIAANVMRNFSRLAKEGGVWIPTKVTIGYDAPWRQVRALLLMAAGRTEGIATDPAPRVLQTALQDFYVEYTLLVNMTQPASKPVVFDRLHANIQDAFNEYGVQIMSPNYRSDPAAPKLVPKERWHESPATPDE
jgi:small-conductance mechanosensitive channel